MQHRHEQFTPTQDAHDDDQYSDDAMRRLITDLADDGVSSGLMYMAATPGLTVADDRHGAIVLAEAFRRGLAPVARTLQVGDVFDALTRFLDAAREEVRPMTATPPGIPRCPSSAAAGGETNDAA